jgi:hypothetical protein
MPPFKFLFEVVEGEPDDARDAIKLLGDYRDEDLWIVPTEEARELVGYLLSLDQQHDLEQVQ